MLIGYNLDIYIVDKLNSMKKYAIITENDISIWNDETGARYHFPNRYKNILRPGTNIIYYKGMLKEKSFKHLRLMDEPHYFGYGRIGNVYIDYENTKNLYAEIEDYIPFEQGVYFRMEDGCNYETVLKSNYWRDGVRKIDENVFNNILSAANIKEQSDIESLDNLKIELTEGSLIKYIDVENAKTSKIFKNINIKEIGDIGEKLVLTYLKQNLDEIEAKSLIWVANEGETPGYDIVYTNLNNQKVCIEVKSTTAKKFPYFYLTINEYNASQIADLYYIYLVSDCRSSKPKIEILSNPFMRNDFKIEPIAFKVFQLN